MMRRIAVTGATSMLGIALVREALDRGIGVAAIVRRDSAYADMLPDGADTVTLEMGEYKDAAAVGNSPVAVRAHGAAASSSHAADGAYQTLPQCDCFFHLAWGKTLPSEKDAARGHAENIIYAIDAVTLAHKMGCTAFVGAGSQAEYGVASGPIGPMTATKPESGYGVAKFAAGKLTGLLAKQLGMRHNWVRIVSVYGPGARVPAIIPSLIQDFSRGVCPRLSPCEQMWDFLYSADAARAMLDVAEKGVDNKTYVLGSGVGRPLKEYVTQIRDIVNPAVKLQFGTMSYYPHQAMYLVADITELKRDTGWKPVTRFADGIEILDRMRGGQTSSL